MAVSMYHFNFKGSVFWEGRGINYRIRLPWAENLERKEVCTVKLEQEDVQKLMEAIEDRYYFEFVFGKFCLPPDPLVIDHFAFQMSFQLEGLWVVLRKVTSSLIGIAPFFGHTSTSRSSTMTTR